MTRSSLTALLLAVTSLAAGSLVVLALARWLGWAVTGTVLLAATGAALLDVARWPRGWRPW